jgi:aspartate-semialdehyde dehydrogenase
MKANTVRLALVGSETLLGRELKEVLESAPNIVTEGFAANGEANFGEEDGEAVFREALSPNSLNGVSCLIAASSEEGSKKALELAKAARGRLKVIDCTGHMEAEPEARISAPLLGRTDSDANWLLVMAHPAAVSMALLLTTLHKQLPISRSVVEVFEPASERGKLGVLELQQQTTGLLAFKTLEKAVFDAQVSFNLLPAYGEEAKQQLETVEQRIERHLATLLARDSKRGVPLPMPSLRLVHAPVFHGYTFSMWIEFATATTAEEIAQAIQSKEIEVRRAGEEPPSNVSVAGQSGLIAGDIRVDRNNPRAVWIWLVADNLRIMADSVADIIRPIAEVGEKS